MEHSVVLAIPESEIERTVASDPNLALKLARTLARRLARTSEQLKDLLEISSRRARAETFDDFLGNLPYSRREQLLLETAQATWLDRQSGLSFVDARIRLRNLDRDLAEMRERRDMFADPIGHVADAAGLARPYEERLRAEFGRLAD
jgi:CRP-like cAMP-binding protein